MKGFVSLLHETEQITTQTTESNGSPGFAVMNSEFWRQLHCWRNDHGNSQGAKVTQTFYLHTLR
jgi:hypothetical protein